MARARIPDAAILDDVRRLAAAHPRLSWKVIQREGRYAGRTYERFGSRLDQILRRADLPPRPPAAPPAPLPAALTALAAWTDLQIVLVWRVVRWPDPQGGDPYCVRCPRCGDAASVREIPTQRLGPSGELAVYGCADCAYHFSDVTDSFFHGLMMPLKTAALVLVAQRLGVPRARLTAFGLGPNGGGKLARRAAESRLAQTFIDRLLAIIEQETAP